MSSKHPKTWMRFRRYSMLAVGVVATVGGVAGNVGSIVDLFDKFFGKESSAAPSVDVSGRWQAEVVYDWGLRRSEHFEFRLHDNTLQGTATFLGVPRGVLEGQMKGERLSFVLRTQETAGSQQREVEHRYTATAKDEGQLEFEMLSTGGLSQHVPIEFIAKRVKP